MIRRGRLPAGARLSSFSGLSLRTLRARPLRSGLTAGAIVLGVGMVFGVLLLVGTIHSTFGRLYDSIYGRTDIIVSGKAAAGALEASTIDGIRQVKGVRSASGTIFTFLTTVDARGRVERGRSTRVYAVGTDYSQPDTTDSEQVAGRNPRPGAGEIEVDSGWAAERGLRVGDPLRVSTPTGIATLRISGTYALGGGISLGGYGTASMPLQDARRLMDKPDTWDEIAVVVAPGTPVGDVRARLQRRLPEGVDVVTPQTRSNEVQDQLAGLDVVLYFFSGIALFVGAFLILNSFNMTVLQRMREIGTLRALGASDRRVAGSLLAEAVVLGAVGSVLGLALGAGLAVLLLKAIQGFGLPVGDIEFSGTAVVGALVTGMLATLAGAVWPAVRAARVAPIEAMRGGTRIGRPPGLRRALVGLALFVPGMAVGGLFWFGDTTQGGVLGAIGGIGSTVVLFVGMVLLAPFVVLPLVRLMAVPLRAVMPAEGRLAADAAQSNPHPHRGDGRNAARGDLRRRGQRDDRLELRGIGAHRARPALRAGPDGAAARLPGLRPAPGGACRASCATRSPRCPRWPRSPTGACSTCASCPAAPARGSSWRTTPMPSTASTSRGTRERHARRSCAASRRVASSPR